jgi:hypothetical protein
VAEEEPPLDLVDAAMDEGARQEPRAMEQPQEPQPAEPAADDDEPIPLSAVAETLPISPLPPPEPEDEPLVLPVAATRRIATISTLAPPPRPEPVGNAEPLLHPVTRPEPVLPAGLPIRRVAASQGIRRLVRPKLPPAEGLREPPSLAAAPGPAHAEEEPIALPAVKAAPPMRAGE